MLFNVIFFISSFTLIKVEASSYLGCYETTDNSKLLYQHKKIDDKLTPNSCVALCRSMQLAYAGLQDNECRCGQHKPSELVKLLDKECNSPCPGDKNAKCGKSRDKHSTYGPTRISVYYTDVIVPAQKVTSARIYIACYTNTSTIQIRLYGPSEEFQKNNSPSKCHEFCYQRGFRYFALSGELCTCGDDLPLEGNIDDSTGTQCGSKCSGDKTEYCGEPWKLSFYATGIPNIPEYGRFVGCFKNTNVEDIKPEVTLELTESNSNQRCLNICDQKGFQFAGVQKGTLCLCINQPPTPSLRKKDLICEKEDCPGEITKKCGSEDGIKLFKTRIGSDIQSAKPRYLGCYRDQKEYRELHEIRTITGDMTLAYCMETCKLKGYTFSSLVYGADCICSHLFPSANEKVSQDDCRFPCGGNRKEQCGGRGVRGVYNNGLPYPQAYVQYFYLGCYEDIESEKNVLKGTKTQINNLSPTICHKHCLKSGFKFFGLTLEPKVCFCSDEPPPDDLKYSADFKSECPAKYRSVIFRTGLAEIDADQSYQGCYKVDETILNKKVFYAVKTLTPKKCLMLCDMLGFLYSGVNEGWDCHCGNAFPNTLTPENENKCSIRCPGDPLDTCGGSEFRMKVYRTSVTTAYEEPQPVKLADKHIFSGTFNTLDMSVWSYTIKFPQEPDYEFVTYDKSDEVVYVKQGKLFIKPKIQSENFVVGALTLKNCTGKLGGSECTKKAANYYILPPVLSGQLTTKDSFSFKNGKIEIRAKLPIGDWIVPEIWLMPQKNEYGEHYQSGQIRIAMSRGSSQFQCSNGDYGHKRLEMGVYVGPEFNVKNKVFYKMAPASWTNEFHNYTVIWNIDKISFQVDGEELGTMQPESGQTIRDIVGLPKDIEYIYGGSTNRLAPFDKEFYITLGLSVGGSSDFPDTCTSNPKKPWSNTSPKAMLNFWQKRDQWRNTWNNENSALQIEKVDVWSL